jgi:outer membrane biosynthesis protein TonB
MNAGAAAKWVLLALAGLAVAVAVAIAASHLTSQQIGIASESVSAGDALAPSLRTAETQDKRGGHRHGDRKPPAEPPERTETTVPTEPGPTTPEATVPVEPAEPPSEGGEDHGGHVGGGGDD